MRDNLRELNERLTRAFEAAVAMPPDELTACRRFVVHGLPIPFSLTAAHTQLANDLKDCLEYAQQRSLDAVVGYCMAGAQSPDLLVEEADAGVELVQHFVRDTVPPPATVLDVASGMGHFSLPLASEGYEVTLFDPVTPFLEAAIGRAAPAVLQNLAPPICGSFEDLADVESESCDICLCMRSVYYAQPRALAEEVIGQLGRIARKAVAVDVMSKESLILRLDDEGIDASPEAIQQIRATGVTPPARPEGGGVVYSCFSVDELKQVLTRAGLRIHKLLGCEFGDGGSQLDRTDSEVELHEHLLALCRR